MNSIFTRRSIRTFKNVAVSDELIDKIILSGIASPSAKNKQPWYFVVVKKKEIKDYFADLLETKSIDFPNKGIYIPTAKAMREASHLIVVFNTRENVETEILSLGACIENMLLEATNLELGSLWIHLTDLIEEEIQKELEMNYHLISTIAIGVSNETPKERPRKSLEEVCVWKGTNL